MGAEWDDCFCFLIFGGPVDLLDILFHCETTHAHNYCVFVSLVDGEDHSGTKMSLRTALPGNERNQDHVSIETLLYLAAVLERQQVSDVNTNEMMLVPNFVY